ncbi:DUF11 domain-containing protein [bacterium]|nr:MAG: DUF11 domain-containing protein [bacterium]
MNIKSKNKIGTTWLTGIALMGCAGFAFAQGTTLRANIVPELTAFKVVSSNGAEKLTSADKIAPGDVIEYQVRYANTGGKAARQLQAILPIPASLQFVSGSAQPAGALASLDGKTYSAMPLKRSVKAADGSTKTVVIPTSEYRYLRWSIDNLDAGKAVKVEARAQLANLKAAQ